MTNPVDKEDMSDQIKYSPETIASNLAYHLDLLLRDTAIRLNGSMPSDEEISRRGQWIIQEGKPGKTLQWDGVDVIWVGEYKTKVENGMLCGELPYRVLA